MTHADILRVFSYSPVTADQEADLYELHKAAQALGEVIYRCVSPNAAQQAIQQLTGITAMCRTAIEVSPRQAEKKLVMMS